VQKIGGLEEELKLKLADLNVLKSSIQQFERRTQGNLMVRGLTDIVQEDDVLDSEYMTTVMVVIQKSSMKEFLLSYEKMADYVVPLSAKAISEDSEYVLFGVTLFKKSLDQFKLACRDKRFAVRDFTFDAEQAAADDAKKSADETEYARQIALLANWCVINYAEVLIMYLHLKAIRVFIESVLRYGLIAYRGQGMAPNMQAVILQPKRGKVESLRKALNTMFLSSSSVVDDAHEEVVVPGAGGDFFPYVSVSILYDPPAL
jgi:V-type H+-transporting ATPase subunit C